MKFWANMDSLNGEILSSTLYLLPPIYPLDPDPQHCWILLLTPTCKNTNTALYGAFTADIPTFTLEQMDTTDEKNEIKES